MLDIVDEKLKIKEKVLYSLIMLYPVLNMWSAIVTNHSSLRIFYFAYSIIILLVYMWGLRIKKSLFFLVMIIVVKLIYDLLTYPGSLSDAIEVAFLLIYLSIYSDNILSERYIVYLSQNAKVIFGLYVIYLIGVVLTLVTGVGFTNTWNTLSVQGPYGLAHIFAYELLILLANCYLLFLREKRGKKVKWILLMGIIGVLLLFTTVRTVLLCIVVVVGYIFLKKNGYKKFGVAVLGVIGLLLAFRYTNIFNSVLEKTEYAISLGSVTNARSIIWESSWNYYLNGTVTQKLLGNGIEELMRWNHAFIRMHIQAHNDFLTVLAAFGLITLTVYLFYLVRFCKQKGGLGLLLALLVLIIYNGLYSYSALVIGLPSLKLVFETINNLYVEKTPSINRRPVINEKKYNLM